MQYYILMIDYGRGPRKPMGFGANVQPEDTRQNIVDEVRDILASNNKSVAFVHYMDGLNPPEDVTEEILREAHDDSPDIAALADLQAARFDHAQDYRKHGEAV